MKKFFLTILTTILLFSLHAQKRIVIGADTTLSVKSNNYYYVSKATGNNNRAKKGDPTRAWSDPWTASNSAPEGSLIYIMDGRWTYSWDQTPAEMVLDSAEISLVDDKSIDFYFAPKTALTNVSVNEIPFELFTVFDVKPNKIVNIYGEGSFFGNDNGIIGSTSSFSTLNVNLDTLQTSPTGGGEDTSWKFSGFNVKNDTLAIFSLSGNQLITNYDVAASITGNCIDGSFYVKFKKQFDLKSDGSIHFRSATIKNTSIYTEVDHYIGENPEWYVWSPYRVFFENCNVTAKYNNVLTYGTPYTWNSFYSIRNGDHVNSNFDLSLSGKGVHRIMNFEVGNGSNSFVGTTSNSTYNFNFKHVADSLISGNPIILMNNADSSIVNMKINLLNYDTNITVFSAFSGDWVGADVTIEGNVKSYGKNIFDIRSNLGVARKVLLKNFYSESTENIITSTVATQLNTCNTNIKESDVTNLVNLIDDCGVIVNPTSLQEAIDTQSPNNNLTVSYPDTVTITIPNDNYTITTDGDSPIITENFIVGSGVTARYVQKNRSNNDNVSMELSSSQISNNESVVLNGGNTSLRLTGTGSLSISGNTSDFGFQGITYSSDYSSSFSNRSLIPREYVSDRIWEDKTPYELNQETSSFNSVGISNTRGTIQTYLSVNKNLDPLTVEVNPTNSAQLGAYDTSNDSYAHLEANVGELFLKTNIGNVGSEIDMTSNSLLLNYIPSVSNFSLLNIRENDILVSSSSSIFQGLSYASDYSANYTDRSLVDKAFIDSKIFEGFTDYENNYGNYNFKGFRQLNGTYETFIGVATDNVPEITFSLNDTAPNDDFKTLKINQNSISLNSYNGTNNSGASINIINSSTTPQITLSGTNDFAGAIYNADYSTNFIDRSLVDKAYVDDKTYDQVVVVKQASDFGVIDPSKIYFVDGIIDMDTFRIRVPAEGMSLKGHGFRTSKLVSTADNYTLFESVSGGSGDLYINGMTIEISGVSSQVYNLTATGFPAVEIEVVNFDNCTSLGEITDYRQGLEFNTGRFGGTPELTLSGTWVGGYIINTSLVRGITDGAYSIFKAGTSFTMGSRFKTNINAELSNTVSLIDFSTSNFTNNNTLQLNSCIITRNEVTDAFDTTISPNINESDVKSYWKDNVGLRNTRVGIEGIITTEVATNITTASTFVELAGTFTASKISHFSQVSNNRFTALATSPTDYNVNANVVIQGGANDDITLLLRVWDNSASTFIDYKKSTRSINNLVGGNDVVYFNVMDRVPLDINDYVVLFVANETSTINVTALLDSEIIITEF